MEKNQQHIPNENNEKIIHLRLEESDYHFLKAIAQKQGYASVSALIKAMLLNDVDIKKTTG